MTDLLRDVYAPSSLRSMDHKWTTIKRALAMWNLTPLPPTREAILALGAALKKGRFQSADSYLSLYRTRAEREGYALDPSLNRLVKDVARSCNRGRGGPVKPMGLPLDRLGELPPLGDEPWVAEGPVGPGRAIVLGAWFMMREQELSTTRACLVSIRNGDGGGKDATVSWTLPASKTDVEAAGVTRSHGCCCVGGRSFLCPVHAAEDQMNMLEARLPSRFASGVPDADLPFFPTAEGNVVTKGSMTDTIIQAATLLKVPKTSADGNERVSGHSLRVTGAQGLTKAGLDTWAVQLLGRWGSDTVLTYIRNVPLQKSAEWARDVIKKTLAEKLKEIDEDGGEAPAAPSRSCTLKSVKKDFTEELREAKEAESSQLAPITESVFVRGARGSFHRVGRRPDKASPWTSACGWRFDPSEATVLFEDLPEHVRYKFLCAKCLGEAREYRKAAVEAI